MHEAMHTGKRLEGYPGGMGGWSTSEEIPLEIISEKLPWFEVRPLNGILYATT